MIEQRRLRHRELHKSLDELLACFFTSTSQLDFYQGKPMLDQPIRILIEFSYRQCIEPTCGEGTINESP